MRLFAAIIIVSLICACGGSEQASDTPDPTRVARATHTPEAIVPPSETSVLKTTDVPLPPTAPLTATSTVEPTPTRIPVSTATPTLSAGLITFYSERDGNPEIYVMNPDGGDQRRLTFSQYEDSSPDWSPDGSRIAFISERDDPQAGECSPDCMYQIYMINADGSDVHRVVETDFRTLHPDWHPDGTKLSFDTEFNLQGDIYVVNADGSGLQRLIEDGFWADWSPDGTQLAFASNRDGNVEIYVADADGSNQRRLTENRQLDYFPDWSPDGRRIAFARLERRQIFVMSADGSNEQQLTHQSNAENPSWSPDGTQIAFHSSQDGDFEIYTIDVESAIQAGPDSGLRQLTDNQTGDLWPSWGSEPAPSSGALVSFEKSAQTFANDYQPVYVSIAADVYATPRITPDGKYLFFDR